MSPKSSFDHSHTCKTCQRGGIRKVSYQPFRFVYRRQDLADIRDFNLTWEWFGPFEFNGKVSQARFPSPYVLVTPKVMNIFREAGVKTFQWWPIWVDEETQ
jgi:hypothetical protein